jgi:hypothetical protein
MLEEVIIGAVSNVGFPIAITFYLFFRFEKILEKHTSMIEELVKEIKRK